MRAKSGWISCLVGQNRWAPAGAGVGAGAGYYLLFLTAVMRREVLEIIPVVFLRLALGSYSTLQKYWSTSVDQYNFKNDFKISGS